MIIHGIIFAAPDFYILEYQLIFLSIFYVYKTLFINQVTYTYVTGPAKIDHVNANYTELYFR